ncbi:unnamed protein product [Rhizopus stolonifer]
MKTKETKKYENLSETTRQVFLNYTPLFPFSFHFGNITTTVRGLHFPSCSFDFPFLPYKLNSVRLITMGHEKQQTMKPSNSAPVATNTKQPQPDISLSTPTKKTAPLIKSRPVPTKNNSLKQKKVQKKAEDEGEEEVPKIRLTLSEKRERHAQRVHQLKKWRVREEREAREVRLQQRKKLMRGESKETVVEETIKKKCVRFNLKKNKTIQIIEGV